MAYDPVNKEIVHACGGSGTEELGTWVYNIEKNEWSKLPAVENEQSRLHAGAVELVWRAKLLVGAAVNRFTVAETEAEAKADLKAKATELAAAVAAFTADLSKSEKDSAFARQAAGFLSSAEAGLKDLAPELAEKITPDTIAAARAVRVRLEQAADALAVIPPGRARRRSPTTP